MTEPAYLNSICVDVGGTASMSRKLRITHFCSWADRLEDVEAFLQRLPNLALAARVTSPDLLTMARLDCDWHAENSRVLASMRHEEIDFLPSRVVGIAGLIDLAKAVRPLDEEWWLVFEGQTPQKLAGTLSNLLALLDRKGVHVCWYAFDEVSRSMPAFKELAPYTRILIHDEMPLDVAALQALRKDCLTIHRSWVANLVPFASSFNEEPEDKIVFLGSQLGLTEHRQKQINFLKTTFKDRFVAIHDHSVPVGSRTSLNRFKVSFCPEGRKFTGSAMGSTHTDRPFWSGCLGMVPVSENSRCGGRLEYLAERRLLRRYTHADLRDLAQSCEQALSASIEDRRRIYDHYNRRETVGTVVAEALHAIAA